MFTLKYSFVVSDEAKWCRQEFVWVHRSQLLTKVDRDNEIVQLNTNSTSHTHSLNHEQLRINSK